MEVQRQKYIFLRSVRKTPMFSVTIAAYLDWLETFNAVVSYENPSKIKKLSLNKCSAEKENYRIKQMNCNLWIIDL